MKKIFTTVFSVLIILLTISACSGNVSTGTSDQSGTSSSTTGSATISQKITTSPMPQSTPTSKTPENKYATYENPHPFGTAVDIVYTNTEGTEISLEVTFSDLLQGESAEQMLKTLGTLSENDQAYLEEYDVYFLRYYVQWKGEESKDWLNSTTIGALDVSGKDINVYPTFEVVAGWNRTIKKVASSEERWQILTVEKGKEFRPAFLIGDPFEAPGITGAYYFANS